MAIFYAAVEAFDPQNELRMTSGNYTSELRLFVLTADDLADALSTLASSIQANGWRLDRVLQAGHVDSFDEDSLPFEVDMEGMVAAALQSGEICLSEAHMMEDEEADVAPATAYATCVEAFDMTWADEAEGEYAGHYQLVVIKADSASEALQILIEDFEAEEIVLLSIDSLVAAEAFPFDAYEFEFEEEDPIAEVLEQGGMIVSNAYAYPPEEAEEPRRLDS
jgi:hypothetical protein